MFPNMAEVIGEKTVGIASIEHYEITKLDAMRDSMRGIWTLPGKVAILKVNGKTFMSDSKNEHRTNYEVVHRATGDVLIAGLGLGMILHPILQKEDVSSVTVVEKFGDVISIVKPTIESDKLTLVEADIFAWRPEKGKKFDVIYFDIWADICTDNLDQISKLHQQFKNFKAKDGWMSSWVVDELRRRRRMESRCYA
jgi:spermidine synthase